MSVHLVHRRLGSLVSAAVLALVGVGSLAGRARAEEPTPIVVVVESVGGYGDAGRIRAGITRDLGIPAISLIESMGRPSLGTLQVAIASGGHRAYVNYVPSDGVQFAVMLSVEAGRRADRSGEWLVAPCVSAVRTSDQRRAASNATPELLDPWLAYRVRDDEADTRPQIPSEVLDPFVGDPPRRVRVTVSDYYLGPEVIDPWDQAVQQYQREQAQHLTRPAPRRRGQAPAPRPNPR
ncbi:MAG: hypothetical protein U0230_02275 [Polyangiales bacterium]